MSLAAALLPATFLAGACGTGEGGSGTGTPSGSGSTAATSTAVPPSDGIGNSPSASAWTSGPTTVKRTVAVPPVPVLRGIRSAAHPEPGFDRIVFDFSGPLPGYEIKYVDRVVADGSGQAVTVPGRRYLQVRFEPAQAHTNEGTATVERTATFNYPMMRGYALAGDFEGVVTIAIGLDDVVGYRVGELTDRIYIDVSA
jgi:hypothetical protein